MDFTESGDESVLTRAFAHQKTTLEAKPLPAAGRPLPETRVLRSEIVEMLMRPGGREIATVETKAPGTLEFIPNRPVQRRRTLTGDHFFITYGARNQLESFKATNAETRSEPAAQDLSKNRAVAVTRSKSLEARFAPDTGQLATLEQWDDFTYEEGERKARAAHATLDQAANHVLLEKSARMWDAGGSTSADRIQLDQRTGDFTATGRVSSTRASEPKQNASEMLSGEEPLHAMAAKMTSAARNRRIVYEGEAVLWQGANRIQADRVEIDRDARTLLAAGHVVTQFLEQPAPQAKSAAAGSRPAGPVFTTVRADRLLYTEADRLARYTGRARLTRPALDVKAAEIRAYLAGQGSISRVEKAIADGAVEISQAAPGRARTGAAEHAEYYSGEEKIVLSGGEPSMTDSLRGEVRGSELTYYANDDRLQVNGAPDRPAKSRIRRKK
jgi:lipopolysaccharide export system protein LptA